VDINGMAHVILTAGDFAASTTFYRKLLPFLGMTIVLDSEEMLYGVGARTALGVRAPSKENEGERFVQQRVGLHHLCFRARDRDSVDEAYDYLKRDGAKIVHPPEDGPWAPGYYSVLFEDPDGVRLEINYVSGKGLFDVGGKIMGVQ
jgi:catechol 2,3-dioxygenase-like lactoylglutathione lyase family enzyme